MKLLPIKSLWIGVLLLGLLTTALITATRYQDHVDRELAATENDARFAAEQTELLFQSLRLLTDRFANALQASGPFRIPEGLFNNVKVSLPALRNILVIDATGTVRAELRTNGVLFGVDVSGEDYFQAHSKTGDQNGNAVYVGDVIQARLNKDPLFPVSHPVYDNTGNLKAVIATAMDANYLRSIHQSAATMTSSRFYILGSTSVLPLGDRQQEVPSESRRTAEAFNQLFGQASSDPTTLVDDGQNIFYKSDIPAWPLSVVVERSHSDINFKALEVALLPATIGLLITLAAAGGTHLYARAYQAVEEKRTEAETMARRLDLATEAGEIGIWEYNLETGKLYWDPSIIDLYGIRLSDFKGTFEDWASRVHPDDFEAAQAALSLALEKDELYDTEFRIVTPAGVVRHIKAYGAAIPDETGKVGKITGVNYDLTELREAEIKARDNQRRFNDIAENIPGAIFQYEIFPDGSDGILYMSPGCLGIWELTWEEIKGSPKKLWDMIDPADLPDIQQSVQVSAKDLTQWDHRWHITTKSGIRKCLHGRGRPTLLPNGTIRFNSLILDVSEQDRIKQEIDRARRDAETARTRLESAIEALGDAFVLFDSNEQIVTCNAKYREFYEDVPDLLRIGANYETLLRRLVELGKFPDAAGREEEWIAFRLERYRNPSGPFEIAIGDDQFLEVHDSRTQNGDVVSLRVDITESRRQTRRLEEMAKALDVAREKAVYDSLHDALTSLPNRRYLERHLAEQSKTSDSEVQLAALHVDLDRFKHINDTLGHAAGDHVLRHVADVLKREAPDSAFVARVGGDEFVLICRTTAAIEALAKNILEELRKPLEFKRQTCRLSASIGVAVLSAPDASELLVDSDIALYKAKDGGRNRYEIFNSDLQTELAARKRLADEILQGLERNEFLPYFQPQFDAETQEFVGIEALVRWNHPEKGLVPPLSFLDVAEDLNVIGDIDRLVLKKSIAACKYLVAEGLTIPKLSVNIGFSRISDLDLLEELEAMDLSGTHVAFELLETIFLDEQNDEITHNIEGLRARGIGIELDDFGSGRASMVSLLKLRPDCIKIDRQLIFPITKTAGQLDLVRAIVEMAVATGIKVTAEGVESREHADLLAELGCNTLQGYTFAKPMPAEDLVDFLKSERWRTAA
jgi:diguanylate cyclase (GGDEF)-like protein